MNSQPTLCPQNSLKAKGVIFTFSLISLFFHTIYMFSYLYSIFPYITGRIDDLPYLYVVSSIVEFVSMLFTFFAVLFFFLYAAGLYKGKYAASVFPLTFLFLLFSSLVSLVSTVLFMMAFQSHVIASEILISFVPAVLMVILYLLSTLNAYGAIKGFMLIIITMAVKIIDLNLVSTSYVYTGSNYSVETLLFNNINTLATLFFLLAIIICVAVNGLPVARRKEQ